MKKLLSYILPALVILLVAAAEVFGLRGYRLAHGEIMCRELRISVSGEGKNFLNEDDVRHMIGTDCGGCINRPVDSLHPGRIEKALLERDYIEKCRVWCTDDGVLHVDVHHCKAVASWLDNTKIWYLCDNGSLYPVKDLRDSMSLRVEGVLQTEDEDWMEDLADAVQELQSLPVDRIVCRRCGELSLHLRGRPEVFDLGRPQGMAVKKELVERYLSRINPSGLRQYSSVAVKYRGQIVCK